MLSDFKFIVKKKKKKSFSKHLLKELMSVVTGATPTSSAGELATNP